MRIYWLDNAKALGIILIIFGHSIPHSYLSHYIYSFHVPLFFFISGYLYKAGKYNFREFLYKKIRTLIIPYLCFAIISYLYWFFVVRNFSLSGTALTLDTTKPLIGILYGIGSGGFEIPMNVALWYLPCLFVVEIIFYFVKKPYTLFAFAALGLLAKFMPFRMPWGLDVALTAVVFYGVGHYYKDSWISYKFLPIILVTSLAFCFLNEPIDMNNLVYGNPIFFYIAAFSGIILFLNLSKVVKNYGFIQYIGSNTVILIGLVGITWSCLIGLTYFLFNIKITEFSTLFGLVETILEILFTVPAIYIINRWLPFIIGRPYEPAPAVGVNEKGKTKKPFIRLLKIGISGKSH